MLSEFLQYRAWQKLSFICLFTLISIVLWVTFDEEQRVPTMQRMTTLGSIVQSQTEVDLFASMVGLMNQTWQQNVTNLKSYRESLKSAIKMRTIDHVLFTQRNLRRGDKIPTIDGVKIRTTTNLMKNFPMSSPFPAPPYRSCSIVGSSDILSGSQCGSLIDSADIVFRFNLAPITGFESDVGTKNTMTTMNPSIYKNMYGNLKTHKQVSDFTKVLSEQRGALIWTPVFAYAGNDKPTFEAIKKIKSVNSKLRFVIQDTRHFIAMREFWKSHGLKTMLSTGFYFVNVALDICDRVNVFGFWPFDRSADGKPLLYHYSHDDIPFPFADHHNMSYEFKLLAAMHSEGLLQLHMGNCTNGAISL
ncbi:alpha-2,8-sialyltransferase 8F-like isoform X2 [Amphiura filiformis]|uniref:alpha-2,8-sialyltransferase 8F-like isoform X2 n=1 Tax=Amphiura filiformis TaxID=82378 RepID=UPI003B21B7ED